MHEIKGTWTIIVLLFCSLIFRRLFTSWLLIIQTLLQPKLTDTCGLWKLSLIFICMLKPRLCDVLARRPYSVGRRMTVRQSLASNPLYLLLQWRFIKCESTFACTFAFYTYLLFTLQYKYDYTILSGFQSQCKRLLDLKLFNVVQLAQFSERLFQLSTILLLKTNFLISSLHRLLNNFLECPRLPPSSDTKNKSLSTL